MIATVDGRATLHERSGSLGDSADRALFHGLRSAVDAVLVGAGTVRTERYGRLIRDPATRRLRAARGLTPEPLACIVSGRLRLGGEVPLLSEPEARVLIITNSTESIGSPGAHVDYVRVAGAPLRLDAALAELSGAYAVRLLLCEGGPRLAGTLLAEGLLDELFLSISPQLASGGAAGASALRIFTSEELDPPARLELLGLLRSGSSLFLRYGVSA
jgi:riboflavin biosynthesis pyrimidine reductase